MLRSPTIGCAERTNSGGMRNPIQMRSLGGGGMLIASWPMHFLSSTFRRKFVLENSETYAFTYRGWVILCFNHTLHSSFYVFILGSCLKKFRFGNFVDHLHQFLAAFARTAQSRYWIPFTIQYRLVIDRHLFGRFIVGAALCGIVHVRMKDGRLVIDYFLRLFYNNATQNIAPIRAL